MRSLFRTSVWFFGVTSIVIIGLLYLVGIQNVSATASEKTTIAVPIVLQQQTLSKKLASITLIAGNTNIVIPLPSKATLYETLRIAQKAGMLQFSGRMYPGLGFFITAIGSLHEEHGRHLFYYKNGIPATVGISSYVPHNGDLITWQLK